MKKNREIILKTAKIYFNSYYLLVHSVYMLRMNAFELSLKVSIVPCLTNLTTSSLYENIIEQISICLQLSISNYFLENKTF